LIDVIPERVGGWAYTKGFMHPKLELTSDAECVSQYVVVNVQQCSKLMVYSTCITTFFVLIS